MNNHSIYKLVQNEAKKLNKKPWVAGKDFIPYSGEYFDEKEYYSAIESLLEGWLVMGKKAIRLEALLSREFGKSFGILTNSGSSANLLMYAALKSKNYPKRFAPHNHIIATVGGFPTTINPALQLGLNITWVDIELETLNIDLDHVAAKIHVAGDILAFAHTLGNPPNMDRVNEIVEINQLSLIEDCCDALGSTFDGKKLGSFGDMASCSFYPAHHITMGEGGYVATNSKENETVLRSLREWGRGCYCVGQKANALQCGTCGARFSNWINGIDETFDHKYVYNEIGYNLKPIEIQAAMGLEQLKKLPEIGRLRRRNFALLSKIYEPYQDVFILPKATAKSDPSWFAFPLTIKKNAKFNRNEYVNYLESKLIQTRPFFAGNLLLQPGYSHIMNKTDAMGMFPNATYAMLNTFFHGTSPVITEEQIAYIGKMVKGFFDARTSL